jgi:hypothetical protein
MSSFVMLVRVVRNDVSEECSAAIITATRIRELGTTLVVTSNVQCASVVIYGLRSQLSDFCRPDDSGAMFLRNVESYMSRTA